VTAKSPSSTHPSPLISENRGQLIEGAKLGAFDGECDGVFDGAPNGECDGECDGAPDGAKEDE
jgi:hypothetical protein